jgi:hypothetical protein
MFRRVLRELLPNWRKNEAIGEYREPGSISPLEALRRKIQTVDKAKPQVRTQDGSSIRSSKFDADRGDTTGAPKAPKAHGASPRDTGGWPSTNPKGAKETYVAPRPTD